MNTFSILSILDSKRVHNVAELIEFNKWEYSFTSDGLLEIPWTNY